MAADRGGVMTTSGTNERLKHRQLLDFEETTLVVRTMESGGEARASTLRGAPLWPGKRGLPLAKAMTAVVIGPTTTIVRTRITKYQHSRRQ